MNIYANTPPFAHPYGRRIKCISKALLCALFLLLYKADAHAHLNSASDVSDRGHITLMQQDFKVKGTVRDTDGNPIPGVNILEKGTTNGISTGRDGNYAISLSSSEAVLVFSFIGYKSEEVAIGNRTSIDVTLTADVMSLEEVVVVGYGTMKKKDMTGATVSADIEAFREAPNTTIMQSLKGAVPGVQIGQVTSAGEEPNLSVRGQTTLSGNRNPLVVVDGVIYRGRISDLNPADIESVEVLKDASSMAIYGAQAANGVFLITTKKGKGQKKSIISFTTSFSTQTPTSDARLLNREEFLAKVRDIEYQSSYLAPDFTQPDPDWAFDNSELLPLQYPGLENGTNFDWYREATSPGYIFDNLIGLSGGTDKTRYYLSGGFADQKGFVLNDKYKRTSIRLNIQTEVTNWLTIGANTFGAFTNYSGISPSMENLAHTSPLINAKDENGQYVINHLGDFQTNPFLTPSADDKETNTNLSGIFFAIVSIPQVEGLTYRINFSNNLRSGYHANSNIYGAGLTGSAYKRNDFTQDVMLDNIVTYDKDINDDHAIKVTLVAGYNKIDSESTSATGVNFPDLTLSYNSLEQAITQEVNSGAWSESSIYQMGRINYNYLDRYLFTATVRRDGFSGFAKNSKFGIFPSLGLGWVLSEESFFQIPAISFLKVRGSYGVNGNQTGRYTSLAQVAAGETSKYVFGDGASTSIGQSVSSLPNHSLAWETTAGLNFGIDFSILEDRISGNLELYKTTTTDLLWNRVLPEMTGFQQIRTNLGEIENTGFEFALQFNPVKTEKFNWDLNLNFAANRNRIVKLLGEDLNNDGVEDDLVSSGLFIGKSIGTVYDYQVDGIWQLHDDIPAGYFPGTYRIVNQDDDPNIEAEKDRVFLGRTEPAYQFGIHNTLHYENFTLRFMVHSIQGGKDGYLKRNHPDGMPGTTGTAQNQNWYSFYDGWSVTNPDGKYPVTWVNSAVPGSAYYSRSFLRLQDVSLAYRLNAELAEKIGFNSAKVFVSGKNLLTLTKWDGWDPETGQGIRTNPEYQGAPTLPVMKALSVGIDMSF